jgi:hypothetical protein
MDDDRFDTLVKELARGPASRRTMVRLLGGLGGAGLSAAVARSPETAAAPIETAANRGSCRATGDHCNGDADCCSRHCRGGRCQCNRRGGHCEVDRACCSGRCRRRKERCA